MTRLKRVWLVIVLIFTACGGGSTTGPSPIDNGALEGTHSGTITFTRPVPMTVPTTWTFTTIPQTNGRSYTTTATWMGITTRTLNTTTIGDQFSANGPYFSPLGCSGFVGGDGTIKARTIEASFNGGSTCDGAFDGYMVLTR